uniref:Uncharacterized protein n=1 Tax=Setaria italica TaxID=4555 RepID=K4AGM1_SETIT
MGNTTPPGPRRGAREWDSERASSSSSSDNIFSPALLQRGTRKGTEGSNSNSDARAADSLTAGRGRRRGGGGRRGARGRIGGLGASEIGGCAAAAVEDEWVVRAPRVESDVASSGGLLPRNSRRPFHLR